MASVTTIIRGSLAGLIALFMLLMVGCSSGLDLDTTASVEIVSPEPEILGVDADEEHSLSDYKVRVNCRIKNNGVAGIVKVKASVSKGGWWQQERVLRFAEGATRRVEFVFPEPSFWSSGPIRFECNPYVDPDERRVRVDCLVANKGESSGTVRVEATLAGSTTVSRIELTAEQAKEVSFLFRAQQVNQDTEYGCRAEEVVASG